MLKIDYQIEIGSLVFKPGSNSRLIGLHSQSSMGAPVAYCRMAFTVPADLSMAVGDPVTVQLGYDGDLSTVFTGAATEVEWQLDQVIVEAESLSRQLAALRVNMYFENAFTGDIASSLAGETELSTGRLEPGLQLPFYAVGSNRSAWDHLAELALQCGFDLYTDERDQLVFGSAMPGVPKLFQFGINMLRFQVEERQPAVSGVEVFGESPASHGGGPDSATWFTKKEVKGSAGSNPKQRVYAPAGRSQELTAQMANNIWSERSIQKTGRLRTLGDAAITLGTLLQVSGMPADHQNGTYRTTSITHRVHPVKGFLTDLQVTEV